MNAILKLIIFKTSKILENNTSNNSLLISQFTQCFSITIIKMFTLSNVVVQTVILFRVKIETGILYSAVMGKLVLFSVLIQRLIMFKERFTILSGK